MKWQSRKGEARCFGAAGKSPSMRCPCIPVFAGGLGTSSWITVPEINVHHASLPAAFLDVPLQRGHVGREDLAGQEWQQHLDPSFPPPGWEDRVFGVHPGTVGHLPGDAGREAEV